VPTPTRADVVIIGGGVIGAATAFHLCRHGVTDVVLVERDVLASGSTSKSAGGIRLQFADELNVRIMQRSIPEFEQFEQVIGEHTVPPGIDFHQVGYLFVLTDSGDAADFDAAVRLQRSLGVDTVRLSAAEAAALVPGLVVDDVLMATFNAREGHCSPEAVVAGYASAARAMGATIVQGVAATAIEHHGGRVSGVTTSAGRMATSTVVCAAGAWAAEVGATAGVDIPITAMRRHMWFTPDACGLPDSMPMTIDFATSFYAHRQGQGLVFGGKEDTLEQIGEHATARLPMLAEAPITATWSGFYEVSPDHNAIVGAVAELDGLYVAGGFSGHGFQQAPAIGEHLAELITGRQPTLDLSLLSAQRFRQGERRHERFVV
jgi:sarcosine oxidase subunit beta